MKRYMKRNNYIIYILLAVLWLGFSGCKSVTDNDEESEAKVRGDVVDTTPLETYTATQVQQICDTQGLPRLFTLTESVKTIRIVYRTIDVNGAAMNASAALMIPQKSGALPLLSLQHGTVSERYAVASRGATQSAEGLVGLYMGAYGYMVCIPDYQGYGDSEGIHPYLHVNGNAVVVIDLLRAVRKYCQSENLSLSDKLFLGGYSEGGHLTMATQKIIERDYAQEFTLTAVAPMAGPYDLAGSMRTVFQDGDYVDLAYIGFIFTAFNDIYGWNRLNDVFIAPYGDMMAGLYDGTNSWGTILSQLPDTFTQLVNPAFVQGMLDGSETEVLAAIQENTLLDWTPQAPMRLFHGSDDQVVPFANAATALSSFITNGSTSVELVTYDGMNHQTAALPCYMGLIVWFNGFGL
ncbi:MAG: hypothetical protein GY765_31510 [bacterium]|nr:hypothetical protein [bacterium]